METITKYKYNTGLVADMYEDIDIRDPRARLERECYWRGVAKMVILPWIRRAGISYISTRAVVSVDLVQGRVLLQQRMPCTQKRNGCLTTAVLLSGTAGNDTGVSRRALALSHRIAEPYAQAKSLPSSQAVLGGMHTCRKKEEPRQPTTREKRKPRKMPPPPPRGGLACCGVRDGRKQTSPRSNRGNPRLVLEARFVPPERYGYLAWPVPPYWNGASPENSPDTNEKESAKSDRQVGTILLCLYCCNTGRGSERLGGTRGTPGASFSDLREEVGWRRTARITHHQLAWLCTKG